jgi:hypothetical protein
MGNCCKVGQKGGGRLGNRIAFALLGKDNFWGTQMDADGGRGFNRRGAETQREKRQREEGEIRNKKKDVAGAMSFYLTDYGLRIES